MSERIYTKNGRPLQVHGDKVYSRSGQYVGRIRDGKIFDASGRYAATIVNDRAVYRSIHSARIISASSSGNRSGIAASNRVGSAIMGEEPRFPD